MYRDDKNRNKKNANKKGRKKMTNKNTVLENYKGVIPAFITPFDKNGNYSAECAKQMMEWQIAQGIGGYYFLGSNGYGPAMDSEDRMKALESMVEIVNGRIPTVAHIASVSTKETIKMASGLSIPSITHAVKCSVPFDFILNANPLSILVKSSVLPHQYPWSNKWVMKGIKLRFCD